MHRMCEAHDIMSAREPTCLHDWRTTNWIMIVAKATVSTKGANHDIMMKNRLLARDDFSNELCSRYYIMKNALRDIPRRIFSYHILYIFNIIFLLIFKEWSL